MKNFSDIQRTWMSPPSDIIVTIILNELLNDFLRLTHEVPNDEELGKIVRSGVIELVKIKER